ncbi:hypothetical protein [Aeromonas media]|uniref:hypothetical protein n=1 Tax=Aeromonas media TaxID=651 RepID=UPI003D02CED0
MKDEKPFWGKRQAAHSGLKVDDLDAQAERALKQACGFADTVRRDRRPLPRRHVTERLCVRAATRPFLLAGGSMAFYFRTGSGYDLPS